MPTEHQGKIRILIYGINYSPEPVGIGKYTGEFAKWLSANGLEVRVITAPSYFPQWRARKNYYQLEHKDDIAIFRCPLWVPRKPNGLTRLIHLSSFAISSVPVVLRQARWKPDIIFTVAPAFFCAPISLMLKRLCKINGQHPKTYLHIQDFELDAAFELGILKGPLIRKLAERWECSVLRGFDIVSTISQAMRNLAIKKGVNEDQAFLLPNWVRTSEIFPQPQELRASNPYRKELGIRPDQTVLLYSGSMNKKQGLDVIAEAIEMLKSSTDFVWILAGDGPSRAVLEARVKNYENVRLLPLQPQERMNDWLNLADIHLLPQKKGAADLVLPSKLLGIMASGRPVIASSPEGTELANLATEAGIRIEPENSNQLARAILMLTENKGLAQEYGSRARQIAIDYFEQEIVMNSFLINLRGQKPATPIKVTQ